MLQSKTLMASLGGSDGRSILLHVELSQDASEVQGFMIRSLSVLQPAEPGHNSRTAAC